MFYEIQEAIHGPDHLAEALLRKSASRGAELVPATQQLQIEGGQDPSRGAALGLATPYGEEDYPLHTPRGDRPASPADDSPDRLLNTSDAGRARSLHPTLYPHPRY